ncbi:hypothetical protein POTOM_017251 [Populus tomentosa]|uniref:MATE efflux family protein n=1 Tax=Populus tomentosa TaxID=118781 RepID=A0A8X8AAE7_POPTO|nr:hypothetical protein POTOM_017251 [Populus tomentosa]
MEEEGKREERKWAITWEGFVQELKKTGYIAAPMVAVSVLQYLLQVVSVIIVGHLGALALSSAAIATSITNVTGFSLLKLRLLSVPLRREEEDLLQESTSSILELKTGYDQGKGKKKKKKQP